MSKTLLWLAALVAGALAASPARAECTGTLSGALKTTFKCKVDVRYSPKQNEAAFMITVPELPAGITALAPALATIKGKPEKKSYDEKTLEDASTSVVTKAGKSYLGKRGAGSLKVTLTSVEGSGRRFTVSGTASGVAKDLNGKGEVKVEVKF